MLVGDTSLKQAVDIVDRDAQFRQVTRLDEDAELLHQPVKIGAVTGRDIINLIKEGKLTNGGNFDIRELMA